MASVSGKQELIYRGHTVRIGVIKGIPQATVCAGSRLMHSCQAATIEEAQAAAYSWVDAFFANQAVERKADNRGTSAEYYRYFTLNPPAGHECAMLKAHAEADGCMLSATQLANAAGWPSFSSANVHYGKLGKDVARTLGLKLQRRKDKTEVFTTALATYTHPGEIEDDADSKWTMHPELVDALVRLGIARA